MISVLEQAAARTLLFLAHEHKEACPNAHCEAILASLIPIYRELVGRELNSEEAAALT